MTILVWIDNLKTKNSLKYSIYAWNNVVHPLKCWNVKFYGLNFQVYVILYKQLGILSFLLVIWCLLDENTNTYLWNYQKLIFYLTLNMLLQEGHFSMPLQFWSQIYACLSSV